MEFLFSSIFPLNLQTNLRPVRLSVRTLGFHPRKRGSTPLRATTNKNKIYGKS